MSQQSNQNSKMSRCPKIPTQSSNSFTLRAPEDAPSNNETRFFYTHIARLEPRPWNECLVALSPGQITISVSLPWRGTENPATAVSSRVGYVSRKSAWITRAGRIARVSLSSRVCSLCSLACVSSTGRADSSYLHSARARARESL